MSFKQPGITFRTETPPPGTTLPRMDIAAFVGFASSGPLQVPVPIEDMAQFRNIYGDDLELAWDPITQGMEHAYLASAVDAFFQNGGRRCWIVRVADKQAAQINRFALPGMVQVVIRSGKETAYRPATVMARSEGCWSDDLRVSTVRESQAVRVLAFYATAGTYTVDISTETPVIPGDLLQLTFGPDGPVLFLTVESLQRRPEEPQAGLIQPALRIASKTGCWFLRHPIIPIVPADTAAEASVTVLSTGGGEITFPGCRVTFVSREQRYQVEVPLRPEQAPLPGNILFITFSTSEPQQLLLVVKEIEITEQKTLPPGQNLTVSGSEEFWPVLDADIQKVLGDRFQECSPPRCEMPVAERVEFQMIVWKGEQIANRLGSLAFSGISSRFWELLPSDERLFQRPGDEPDRNGALMNKEVLEPRFPLAAPDAQNRANLYLPLGMALAPDYRVSQGRLSNALADTNLGRNGLEKFEEALFIDPDLADVSMRALLGEAEFKYYLKQSGGGVSSDDRPAREGQLLKGLHSILPLAEVTLVAIPDAVHRGWKREEPQPVLVLAPPQFLPPLEDGEAACALSWTAVPGAENYLLEESADPEFLKPLKRENLANTMTVVSWQAGEYPRLRHFRIHARGKRVDSPWSNTVSVVLPPASFLCCRPPLAAPTMEPIAMTLNTCVISWTLTPAKDGMQYTLQEASDPHFLTGRVIYEGDKSLFTVPSTAGQVSYYRVRAEQTGTGPWRQVKPDTITCNLPQPPAARQKETSLRWEPVPDAAGYELQEAYKQDLSDIRTIYRGPETSWTMTDMRPAETYYRVRALQHAMSSWSNAVWNQALPVGQLAPRMLTLDEYHIEGANQILLDVHRALLRFCAARGDLLAILALPEHYTAEHAAAHCAALRSFVPQEGFRGALGVPPLEADEDPALSFGALYYPWMYASSETTPSSAGGLAAMPPDGAVCGTMAATAAVRGAWVAPANIAFRSVVTLNALLERESWAWLAEAQVNLVQQDPRGFLVLGADTLSPERALRPVSVRRLLILLRRLALREGMIYVFEPNNEVFRRMVQHSFDQLLSGLYLRGAFSGRKPDEAYRVITDETINTQSSIDQGRFVVELRVAPSQPMAFVTVRLIQTNTSGLAVMEV